MDPTWKLMDDGYVYMDGRNVGKVCPHCKNKVYNVNDVFVGYFEGNKIYYANGDLVGTWESPYLYTAATGEQVQLGYGKNVSIALATAIFHLWK